MYDFEKLDFYELLGVPRNASSKEIKKAYRREIARYHPDRYANAPADEQAYAAARAQRINEAQRTLSDFSSRSAYTRNLPAATRGSSTASGRPADPQPAEQPRRDRTAELYEQAQAQLAAEQYARAATTLRQLQQINPFYRDSAALLERAEAVLRARPRRQAPLRWVFAGLLGLLLVGIALGALAGLQNTAAGIATAPTAVVGAQITSTTSAEIVVSPTGTPELTGTPVPAPTGTPEPTVTPELTSTPEPTSTPVPVPTSTPEPTSTPVPVPTSTPEPTSTPVSVPTIAPSPTGPADEAPVGETPAVERGEILRFDDFSVVGLWATASNTGWSVGYAGNAYRITTIAGLGDIWSYNTAPRASDISIGIDVEVSGGAAGLLLRFVDGNNYLTFLVDPAAGSYRVARVLGGGRSLISQGTSPAIRSGAGNRLVAELRAESMQLYINGSMVDSIDLGGVPQADRFGMVASSGSSDTVALFRNLAIRDLP